MKRDESLQAIRQRQTPWDVVVIGGGATGVAIALDATTRGLQTLLLEQADFGKGTSSRSTKLIHGGVRYLQQGNLTLVRDALRERSLLRSHAPHLVHDLPFLIPCASRWQRFYYGVGLKLYDLLATGRNFGRSYTVSQRDALQRVKNLKSSAIRGGVIYHDGQFDDTRLLISMARSAAEHGATLLNYTPVTAFTKNAAGQLSGLQGCDQETGEQFELSARCIVNATGPFCDAVRRLDDADCEPMLAASQGIHLVLPRRFFPSDTAMIVPKTSDGRVIFIIPWHEHAVVGTTDTPLEQVTLEPRPLQHEIEFLLETVARYLEQAPTQTDVLSVFTGIRPLVKGDKAARTASLSRDHVIRSSPSGLVTITGGKWTTARKMAEDCVDQVIKRGHLRAEPCVTGKLRLHGYDEVHSTDPRAFYGTDLAAIQALEASQPQWKTPFHPELVLRPSDVVWAVREEMARTLEDVLARRSRCLFLNAQATIQIAPAVADCIAKELGRDQAWVETQIASFNAVAQGYLPPSAN